MAGIPWIKQYICSMIIDTYVPIFLNFFQSILHTEKFILDRVNNHKSNRHYTIKCHLTNYEYDLVSDVRQINFIFVLMF